MKEQDIQDIMPSVKSKKKGNKIESIFKNKKNIVNIYCTAGYPLIDSTLTVMRALQESGADIIELGIPYSDPMADGPVIQQSNKQALENGMSMEMLFKQLNEIKHMIKVPVILMGYLNPVLQYGMEKFCEDASSAGISGIILPDLPMFEYEGMYKKLFKKNNLHFIFLVTPETSARRIRRADRLSSGFLYAVSSSSTTGRDSTLEDQEGYFKRLGEMNLKNPVLVGFGIKDKHTFDIACKYSAGAVIGSAYINAIRDSNDIGHDTEVFLKSLHYE